MGWRFRRSFRIAPGIRWNISKGGMSWSFGPRGFKLNVSRRGVRRTISVPGTGLSHSQMLSSGSDLSTARQLRDDDMPSSTQPVSPEPVPEFKADPSTIVPLTDEVAIAVVKRWAIFRAPFVGRLLPSAVTSVERTGVERVEATYTARSRRVVLRTEPLLRKMKPTGTLPNPSGFDPWSPAILHQLAPTRAVVLCPSCTGEGRLTCRRCGGAVDIECDVCAGSGSVVSERSGKLIKCRTCGGDGRRRCSCRDGAVSCEVCNEKGVATAWLAVEETQRQERRVDGKPEFVAALPASLIDANVETVFQTAAPPEQLPDYARLLLQRPALQFTPDTLTDRVEQVAVREERSSVATVCYQLAGQQSDVALRAWNGEVQPSADAAQPFRAVRKRLWSAFILALLAGFALVAWFVGRHWYYETSREAAALVVLALAFPMLLTIPVAYSSLPKARRSSGKLLATILPALLVVAGQAVLCASAGPSLTRAEALFRGGQLDQAKREAQAAAELGIAVERARSLHDEVQLELLAANKNPTSLWSQLAQAQFLTSDARRQAENSAVEYTASYAGDLQAKGNHRQSLVLLAGVPMAFRQVAPIRQRALTAHAHDAEGLWRTVRSNAPLADRLAACKAIDAPLKELQNGGQTPAPRRDIEKACATVVAQEASRAKREQQAAAAAQLRAQREALAEQRRQQAAARNWAMAPLQCRDGTLSPSCVCGGSRRGCCSHHGGVAGCSR